MMGEDVWIIVCRDFHGAVGPIPTEAMARELAAEASEADGCTYQSVKLRIVGGRGDVGSSRPRHLAAPESKESAHPLGSSSSAGPVRASREPGRDDRAALGGGALGANA